MPYLVDGNNVMAQRVGWHKDRSAARRRLIHDLVRFVAVRRTKVNVVFDGEPDEAFPEGRRFKGVHILYARHGSDADSRIKELIVRSSFKRDLIVVSSDRELQSFAGRQGAKVMASGQFRALLEECQEQKPSGSIDAKDELDVEEWMEFFNERNP
ncbi:MAG: NYN domain-containing protein [Desulfomonile tiedjei]|nr:NYN domain-containing protein [Desulfomonile tiedjei]